MGHNIHIPLIIFLLSFCSVSFSQTKFPALALETRSKIESDIQKNLTELIGTRLDKKTFNVAVRVKVKEIPSGAKNNNKEPEVKNELPAGMGIGMIDVRELVKSYENKINEMLANRESQKEKDPPKFEASNIEVLVGLDENIYDEAYSNDFLKWLVNRVKSDYGNNAKSEINRYKFLNQNQDGSLTPTSKNPIEIDNKLKFKDYFILIASAFVLLGFLGLGLLVHFGLKTNGSIKKDLVVESKNEWKIRNTPMAELDNEVKAEDNKMIEPVQRVGENDLEHILGKIAFVCIELGSQVNDLVRVWVDSGQNGYIKSALLIDTILAANEKIMSITGTSPNLKIPIDAELVSLQEENFFEAYKSVREIEDYAKLVTLKEIYWDLVTLKTLGIQSLRRPFDYLQSLNQYSLKEVLDNQAKDTKALALMYLPADKQTEYLDFIEAGEKEIIIHQMLTQSQISQRRIWDVDTSLKVTLINQSSESEEKLINLFPKTIEVLQNLDILSEIKMLKNIVKTLPDQGKILKQQYTTLTFLDEWKPEYIKRLVSTCTAVEIVSLIRVLPDAKQLLISACSEKVQMIVNDDLQLNDSQTELDKNKVLTQIKNKWLKISANEGIPMSKVISEVQIQYEDQSAGQNAA